MKQISPLKLVRKHCLECSGGNAKEVAECVIPDCSLYPLRFGSNPNRRGIGRGCSCPKSKLSPEAGAAIKPEEINGKTPSHGGGNAQEIINICSSEISTSRVVDKAVLKPGAFPAVGNLG